MYVLAIMSETKYQMLSGTRCVLDFAEVPSVLFEKLASKWSIMSAIGCPDTNRQSFEWWYEDKFNSDSFQESLKLAFADQLIHNNSPPKNAEDLNNICREAEKLAGVTHNCNEWLSPVGHLANYGSCYYAYILADIVAEKILSRCQIEKCFGMKLRRELLSKGGTVSPIEQLDALGINVFD